MLYGSEEPRVYTPPLRELTPDTSLGFAVIEFATSFLGMELFPWQRWLLVHALETVDEDGGGWHFRFRTVVVLVARQNGKTTLGTVLALFFLYILGVALILGSAQDVSQAEDTWNAVVEMAEADVRLAREIKHVWHTNGAKRLQLTGGRDYRVKASTRKAGRGKSADLVFMDELREHTTWDGWSALSKTGMARDSSIVWCMSNAGDASSVVLRHLRLQAHRALGDPDGIVAAEQGADWVPDEVDELADDTLGLFEWSAEPGASVADRDAWAAANPSLGWCITERAIRSAAATDPRDQFMTECLCQWVTATRNPPFPRGSWEAGRDEESEIAIDSPLWWGVDVSDDRRHTSVCVCGVRPDRDYHVELAAYGNGSAWLESWFRERADPARPMRVALQKNGAPVSDWAGVLAAIDGVEVEACEGQRLPRWCGRFWDSVAALDPEDPDAVGLVTPVRHRSQPRLDMAANVAVTRPLGDGAWAWDRRKSPEDISPLVAATMALGLATEVAELPEVSAYEENDLMMV